VEEDVPDWLTASLDSSAEAPAPSPEASVDFDVPDWLAETAAEPSLPGAFPPAPPTTDETPDAIDVPDWLQDIVSPPGGKESDEEESESPVDMPDWLADIVPPTAAEVTSPPSDPSTTAAWDVPDWITSEEAAEAPEIIEKPGMAAADTSSWLAPDSNLPALDWLFEEQPPPPAGSEAEAPAQEDTDWLFDSSAAPSFEAPPLCPASNRRGRAFLVG
jgi:hypothetical protein